MFIDYLVNNNNQHFRQENTSLLIKIVAMMIKTTKHVMYMAITLNLKILFTFSVVHIQRHHVTMHDTRHIKRI